MALLGGTEAFRLVEGGGNCAGRPVAELQLYQSITDDEKLLALDDALDPFERLLFGETLDIAPDSGADATFARAAKWLGHCVANHESCARVPSGSASAPFMPSRLLRIDGTASSTAQAVSGTVTLIETAAAAAVPYVALSYCWGPYTADIRTTVAANLREHMHGIAVAALPRTVQDAILVVARLGVSYIWVDALCIVQDDPADWTREAATMVDVYAHSHFTISAKGPDSCHQGFLGPQLFGAPEWQRPVPVDAVPSVVLSGGGARPNQKIMVRGGRVDHADSAARRFALDTRGWCLQETVLPRRRLVFDGCEMSWHCLECALCECGHLDEDVSLGGGDGEEDTQQRLFRSVADRQVANLLRTDDGGRRRKKTVAADSDFHYQWTDMVTQYSRRFLTKSGDKLVAISGLAKTFGRAIEAGKGERGSSESDQVVAVLPGKVVTVPSPPIAIPEGGPGDYVAGMWRRSLVASLAWVVDLHALQATGRRAHARHGGYCAPSWSWASVDGPVMFNLLEMAVSQTQWSDADYIGCDVVVREVVCLPADAANVHGALWAGHIVATGPVVAVELAVVPMTYEGKGKGDRDTDLDDFLRLGGVGGRCPCRVRTEGMQSFSVLLDVEQPQHVGYDKRGCWFEGRCLCGDGEACRYDRNSRYACLRLLSYRAEARISGGPEYEVVLFLVLRRVRDESSPLSDVDVDTYERVGLGTWATHYSRQKPFTLFSHGQSKTIKLI